MLDLIKGNIINILWGITFTILLYRYYKLYNSKKNELLSEDERLSRTSERVFLYWFYLQVFIVLYDAILKDFIQNFMNVSTISNNSIQLIKEGNMFFVLPQIIKTLKDSVPEFIKLFEIYFNFKNNNSRNTNLDNDKEINQ
jgi:hypothetical protein